MIIADINRIEGRYYPARRLTQNIVGGVSPIQAEHFSIGNVVLEPNGGQVPWHNHKQEEVYIIFEGQGEMCVGQQREVVTAGQTVYVPPEEYHQITNISDTPLQMLYCYGPAGEVAHWRQELEGTLPEAGVEAPTIPPYACPQHTETEISKELSFHRGDSTWKTPRPKQSTRSASY